MKDHWIRTFRLALRAVVSISVIFAVGCTSPQVTQSQATVTLNADGKAFQIQVPVGSTVQDALVRAGVSLADLDRVEPPAYTLLSDGSEIRVVRVVEEFEIEQVVIPFEKQVIRNETLPEGETRLSQPGSNGLQEITYRTVFEDGVEIARSVVRSVVVEEAIPEVEMVGSQSPFLSVSIPGRLAYLLGGNAWVMEGTTGNRFPIVTSGDLDGRVFNLSPDGRWLLFTRKSEEDDVINTLWAARLGDDSNLLVDFKVENIVHFAQFDSPSNQVAYSTVETRATAPGWQADNGLSVVNLSSSGFLGRHEEVLPVNSGGVYGWWGTNFEFGPSAGLMAFVRPDGVGVVDFEENTQRLLMNGLPYQTGGDWAWVPGLNWSPDGRYLFTVSHSAPEGDVSPETSQQFDLVAVPFEEGIRITLATQVGMFAYPVPSPALGERQNPENGFEYQIAYLQAVSPLQSESSRYNLMVMDRDGSNRRELFPNAGEQGLNPQEVIWSPEPMNQDGSHFIAFIHHDNIWLVNLSDGQAQQITGDGLISRIDWR